MAEPDDIGALCARIAELDLQVKNITERAAKKEAMTRGEFTRALAPIENNLRIAADALTRALHFYTEAAKLCDPPKR